MRGGPNIPRSVPSFMEYRQLGRSGLTVSVTGLGANNFGRRNTPAETMEIVDAALDLGINLIDSADAYGQGQSEEILGDVLKGRRHRVVLATKFGIWQPGPIRSGGSRHYIMSAVEASLRRFKTDYIDLYQLHRPDPLTPIEETLSAMSDLVQAGKVRYIGTSNFEGWQIAEAEWVARMIHTERFISAQNEYSLLIRDLEAQVIPACQKYGVGIIAFRPLAHGWLTGKYVRGEPIPVGTRLGWRGDSKEDADFDVVDRLKEFAQERGVSLLDMAMSYPLWNPAITTVIVGATSVEQIRSNVAAIEWRPPAADRAALEALISA